MSLNTDHLLRTTATLEQVLRTKAAYVQTTQSLIAKHAPEAEVWAYGSRVNGDGHECSDLDLILRNPTDLKKPIEGFFDLKEALEASNIPFFVDIHDWAYLPESFHGEISGRYVSLTD
jgi:uncharacterized protein